MSELPKGWAKCSLSNISTIVTGKTPSKKVEANFGGDIPFIKPGDVTNQGLIIGTEEFLSELGATTVPTIPAGSITVTCIGNLGRTAITNSLSATNQQINAVIPSKSIDTKYLYYYLQTMKAWMDAESSSTTVAIINKTRFSAAPIILAPINEQIRIANKLDSILAKVDKAQARLNKIPAILKRFRQSVLAAATSGELTKEWRGGKNIETWTFPKIKEVGKVQLGRQRSPKYHSGENMRPYLRVQNVFENLIDISDVMEMNFSEEDFQRYQLHNGDILLNEGQSPKFLGRPAIYRDELEGSCFTNTLIRFQANELTIPEFALIVFRNHMHSGRYIEEGTITTNLAHLGAGRFSNVEFPLPPILEQEQIVHSAEKMLNKANKVEQQYLDAKARLDRLTQSILAKAFRGELVPQDPNDEPAEQLLERILKERLSQQQKADKPKKTTKKRATKAKVADKG